MKRIIALFTAGVVLLLGNLATAQTIDIYGNYTNPTSRRTRPNRAVYIITRILTSRKTRLNRAVYTIGTSLEGIDDETVVKSLSSSLWTPAVSASYSDFQTSQSLSL